MKRLFVAIVVALLSSPATAYYNGTRGWFELLLDMIGRNLSH